MTVFLTFDLCTKSMITIFLKSDFYITTEKFIDDLMPVLSKEIFTTVLFRGTEEIS